MRVAMNGLRLKTALRLIGRALLFLVQACASADLFVNGQTLTVRPLDSLVDERLNLTVAGLKPNQPVIIRASTQDADGKLWQAYAGFYADAQGRVEVARQTPRNGTYSGVDSMGLIRSMNLPGVDHNRARFTYKRAAPLIFNFSLESGGRILASAEIVRRFMKPEVRVLDVREDGLIGTLFVPPGAGTFPGLIVLGGSEGGLGSEDVAAQLASHGYAAVALAYFGMDGLPQALEEIPLEYFKKAIDWMMRQRFVKAGGLGVVGTSKGAEAALLVGSTYREIRVVIGYVPSGVVWSCICSTPNKSSWSLGGKPLTFIPQAADPTYGPPQGFPLSPLVNYTFRLRDAAAARRAAITVEKIQGPVLLISATDDHLWPSSALARMIMERLKRKGHPFADSSLVYESAGHLIGKAYLPGGSTLVAGGRLETGGTPAGNAQAQADSWPKVLKFLENGFQIRRAKKRRSP